VVRSPRPRITVPLAVVLAALGLWAVLPLPATPQDEDSLRDRIERGRDRERELSGAIAELDGVIARAGREVAIVQGRLAEVETDLAAAIERLDSTRERLVTERVRLGRLRGRFAEGRRLLAAQLLADYKSDPPDAITLVLEARDFSDAFERIEFVARVQERNAKVTDRVRGQRDETKHQAEVLARLEVQREENAEAVQRRRNALAAMRDGLVERQARLERARAARAAALAGTRAGRREAEHALQELIEERERLAAATGGPGGPWAIPWPIVQCESGGQNLPPNSAGASGYYQFMPETWRRLGGSTPHAYQAPKAEQDRLAATLWAGGAGAHNWVCAELV
jgi:septal ring factor EnvC (AmiA/AmiB activator)